MSESAAQDATLSTQRGASGSAENAHLAERIRAALRLITPDHITPMGRRQIERVLDDTRP